MSTFDQLHSEQLGVFALISKLYTNFKKDGSSRKTKEYLLGRQSNLASYWSDIHARHEEMMKSQYDYAEHNYWNQYQQSKEEVREFNSILQAKLQELSKSEVNDPQTPNRLDILVKFQEESGKKIDNCIKRYQASSEIHSLDSLLEVQSKLKKLWLEFEDRHSEIIEEEKYLEHSYTLRRVFDTILERYKKFEKEITPIIKNEILHQELQNKESNNEMRNDISKNVERHRIVAQNNNNSNELFSIPNDVNNEQVLRYKRQRIRIQLFLEMCDSINIREVTKASLNHEIQQLSEKKIKIDELNEEIMINAEDKEFEMDYFTDNIYNLIGQSYHDVVKSLNCQREVEKPNQRDNSGSIKLPRITVPVFNGKYHEWVTFRDIYDRLIHRNNQISSIEKMQYLKSYTTGDAAQLLRHLEISEVNYETAWNLLNERYDNKRKLVNTQLQALLAQPTLTSESATGIRRVNDQTKECLYAISNLGINIESWAPWVVHITLQKLDCESQRLFEQSLEHPKEIPSFDILYNFMESRFQTLEAIQEGKRSERRSTIFQQSTITKPNKISYKSFYSGKKQNKVEICWACQGRHLITECTEFKQMEVKSRYEMVKSKNLCFRCLSRHRGRCLKREGCMNCKKFHHTLLHSYAFQDEKSKPLMSNPIQLKQTESIGERVVEHTSYFADSKKNVLLATALINVVNNGREELLRVLIDPGSQASFITEEAVQKLRLTKQRIFARIAGIGLTEAGTSTSQVTLEARPRHPSLFKMNLDLLVLNKLTKIIPENRIDPRLFNHLQGLLLADPTYDTPGPIDIILGAEKYGEIIMEGIAKGQDGTPWAQKTELGWIVSGVCEFSAGLSRPTTVTSCISLLEIENLLKRLWELEELPNRRELTDEERICETHFENTISRQNDGKYIVQIPYNDKISSISCLNSRAVAIARLRQMEKKFEKDHKLAVMYKSFLLDYEKLGHMELITKNSYESQIQEVCYLPHHSVWNESSSSTKLRVVFDGSAKSRAGVSLNETMLMGPTLQQNLTSILLRWRKHKFVFTADVEKMYRQIWLSKRDQDLHRICWRENSNQPIQEYKLCTVTYGTKSASYLAVKVLQQLAKDERLKYPEASKIALTDFYVDDLMSGCETLEEAIELQRQMRSMMSVGGFPLKKWSSNVQEVLVGIPEEEITLQALQINSHENNMIKALGVYWQPQTDYFGIKIRLSDTEKITKKVILSETAKIYDPLGWYAPATIVPRILLQGLWLGGYSWDEQLPNNIAEKWLNIKKELPSLERIRIARYIKHSKTKKVEFDGFCDASEKAYSAVIYCRSFDEKNKVSVQLLTAKSKVAPISNQLSIPRLELLGASLLAKLLKQTIEDMEIDEAAVHAWTDSMIVLAWIQGKPNKWKTFVANRVIGIQAKVSPCHWRHIRSGDNPADCASRGIPASQLILQKLWWNGPEWLMQPSICLQTIEVSTEVEKRKEVTCLTIIDNTENPYLLRYSSFKKTKRVLAYCLRLVRKNEPKCSILTPNELARAEKNLVKMAQGVHFDNEIRALKANRVIGKHSDIVKLYPFVDDEGILRVGGRLALSTLTFGEKHPIIIPSKGPLTKMIIIHFHHELKHGGPQLVLTTIRQQYWIPKGLRTVKEVIRKCVICHRFQAKAAQQLMGSLPKARVEISRPFNNVGVDYAGPISIRMSKGRGNSSYKGYISLFICLSTKAVHIEAVSDLTANAFLAAYSRFIGRRGKPENIYSDNGTNFVLASKLLRQGQESYMLERNELVLTTIANQGTRWHFIPPYSPHFGGLWEAGVKSVKKHLKRTIGESKLTFEEISTLLVDIEACLNSRPLCAATDNIEDLEVLTPAHFLIGGSMVAYPRASLANRNCTPAERWKYIARLNEEIWRKWTRDYLPTLQGRPKLTRACNNIKVGDLVIIKEDNLPPTQWALGRVTKTHPGRDGAVRVVDLRVQGNNEIKRPITKISVLPVSHDEEPSKSNSLVVSNSTVVVLNGTSGLQPKVESPARAKKHSLPKKYSISSIFKVIFFIILMSSKCKANMGVKITPLSDTAGIYFEGISQTNLISSEWKLIVHYDLHSYWAELKEFQNSVNVLETICNKVNRSLAMNVNLCRTILSQLNIHLAEIKRQNDAIMSSNSESQLRRSKRGYIDGIGYIAHDLFGVLDSRSAALYDEQIKQLSNNADYLLKLLQNQTSICDATINLFNKSQENVNMQVKLFHEHLLILDKTIAEQEVQNQEAQTFIGITLHIILILIRYQQTQSTLIDLISHAHQGKISPILLHPKQLQNEINTIQQNIPSDVVIPGAEDINLENSYGHVYEIMKAEARIKNHRLIICITIPLMKLEVFQIFHLISIPIKQDNKSAHIVTGAKYLVVNPSKDRYFPTTDTNLGQCISYTSDKLLCKPPGPIYTTGAVEFSCEISLLRHQSELHPSCNIQPVISSNTWVKLHQANTWIYILDNEITIDIICENIITQQKIKGNGILQVEPNCMVKAANLFVPAVAGGTSSIKASYVPSIKINGTMMNLQPHDLQLPSATFIYPNLSKEIEVLKGRIKQQAIEERFATEVSHHDVHQYIAVYLIMVVLVIIIAVLITAKVKQRRLLSTPERQRARQGSPTDFGMELDGR